MKKEKVVLAFSGGLDTSFCAKYLTEECGYELYTAIANTGGFNAEDLAKIEEKAYKLGAVQHASLDITQEYYEKSIKYMIFGNVLRNGTYPISVSSERIFQAIAIINYAKEIGASYVAHGSTGAGNDQVRFDLTFQILAPEIKILTPTRDMTLTREYEIDYLRKHGIEDDFKKMEYSINKGLWGTSIGGKETLKSELTLPEEAYPSQMVAEGEEKRGRKKPPVSQTAFTLHTSGQLVQLDGHAALLVSSVVLMQQTLGSGLIHGLDGHLVSDIGLAAVAFRHGGVKLLQLGLQRGLRGLVLRSFGLGNQHALLGRLDIRQTKHLLRFSS